MGDLITMPAPKPIARPSQEGDTAAILFFTGVRYYRMDEPALAESPAKRPRKLRKKLIDLPCAASASA